MNKAFVHYAMRSADRCRWTLGRASSQLATLCQDHLDQRGFHEREYEGHLALELNIEIQKSGDLAEVNDVESGPRRVTIGRRACSARHADHDGSPDVGADRDVRAHAEVPGAR